VKISGDAIVGAILISIGFVLLGVLMIISANIGKYEGNLGTKYAFNGKYNTWQSLIVTGAIIAWSIVLFGVEFYIMPILAPSLALSLAVLILGEDAVFAIVQTLMVKIVIAVINFLVNVILNSFIAIVDYVAPFYFM
jgi:hypothetical protein